jgi:hypothetical protein
MKKKIYIFFLILLGLLSYLREILFTSINATLAGTSSFYAKTARIEFFLDKSAATLVQLKYGMTIGFTLLFALITIVGLRLTFKNQLPSQLALTLYGICGMIASLVIAYSLLTNRFDSVYSFLRLIIEYLHNPLVYLIISAGYLGVLYSQQEKK